MSWTWTKAFTTQILCLVLSDILFRCFFFFSSRRRHTRFDCDWSSDVCSSDLSVRISHIFELNGVPSCLSLPFPRRVSWLTRVSVEKSLFASIYSNTPTPSIRQEKLVCARHFRHIPDPTRDARPIVH